MSKPRDQGWIGRRDLWGSFGSDPVNPVISRDGDTVSSYQHEKTDRKEDQRRVIRKLICHIIEECRKTATGLMELYEVAIRCTCHENEVC